MLTAELISINPAAHGWEMNSQAVDYKSDALTTALTSHFIDHKKLLQHLTWSNSTAQKPMKRYGYTLCNNES